MPNENTLFCPKCASRDIYIEYHREKTEGEYDERWDEYFCNSCEYGWNSRIDSEVNQV
ncbi:MAG: hypothetical protein GF411_20345 [Candidatus Lokiarchaeota archaeon]|nr:hypothetical protein [Candidatus Lokiarchaeota archaeon]